MQRTNGSLGYLRNRVYLKAESGPNCGGVINPESGLGAAEGNYAATPAYLLESIFVVVRNTRRTEYVSDFGLKLALKVLLSNIRTDAESGGKG
jgi:hypothetical protein